MTEYFAIQPNAELQTLNIILAKYFYEWDNSDWVRTFYCDLGSIHIVENVISPLKTKRRPLNLKTHSVPRCKLFSYRL